MLLGWKKQIQKADMSYAGGITKSLAPNHLFKVKTKFIKSKTSKNKAALFLD